MAYIMQKSVYVYHYYSYPNHNNDVGDKPTKTIINPTLTLQSSVRTDFKMDTSFKLINHIYL